MKSERKHLLLASSLFFIFPTILAGCNGDKVNTGDNTQTNQVTVTSLALKTSPRTDFKSTSTFTVEGGVLNVTKSDGTTEEVALTLDMVDEVPNLAAVEEKKTITIKIKYGGKELTYDITVTPYDQLVPTITFTGDYENNGFTLYLEDTWNITFTVTEGVEYTWWYSANEGETNLGHTQPSAPGTYAISVKTTANEDYVEKSAFRWFNVTSKNKKDPAITFTGDYVDNGFTLRLEDTWNITFTVTEGVEYEWWYSANEGETNLGHTQPSAPGTYAINVKTKESDNWNSVSAFRWFKVVSGAKQDPTITFTGAYENNGFKLTAGEEWNITFTVTEGVEYEWWYSANDGAINLGHTQPTEVGTYAINVKTTENDKWNSVSAFRWFLVVGSKEEAEIVFTDGYVESGFTLYLEDTWNITFTVTEGVEYEWWYSANDGAINLGHTQPSDPGTYAINVKTKENDNYASTEAFRWFKAVNK